MCLCFAQASQPDMPAFKWLRIISIFYNWAQHPTILETVSIASKLDNAENLFSLKHNNREYL